MHYIPAANENIAVNISNGVWFTGFKSGVIVTPEKIKLLNWEFNLSLHVPLLVLSVSDNTDDYGFPAVFITSVDDFKSNLISEFIYEVEVSRVPGVIVVKDGLLK
jgi:hypothetical protein